MEADTGIFSGISLNSQKYIEEKIGKLLNTSLTAFIARSKKCGDYQKFLQANDLTEEKEYHFMKNDEEPSSPMSKIDSENQFDPVAEFAEAIYKIRSAEEEKTQDSVIPNQRYLKKKRKAVFSNPADVFEQESFIPPKYEKSESERVKIKNALMNNMLTNKLGDDSIHTLIAAFQKKSFKKENVLITYGEEGKEYFVLESGVLQCQVFDEETKEITFTKSLTEGNAFGELALLYETPRSATITALTDCTTWVLDQMTFKTVIMSSAIKERNIRLNFIDNIKVFEKMSRYEKIKLLDGLQVQYFEGNDVIVQEGDVGEYFYIIEEGNVECIKEEGKEVIRELDPGDYFGELALIESDQKRTLTVKAKSDCKLLVLNRDTFFRVLGSFSNYLKINYKI
mmetsp:Transcript_31856/g.28207  ORF Transcript_31856/g.28207 Transcript_31856/m.28207 type:complete len:396 (+) Transcript_31856:5-1192(+)